MTANVYHNGVSQTAEISTNSRIFGLWVRDWIGLEQVHHIALYGFFRIAVFWNDNISLEVDTRIISVHSIAKSDTGYFHLEDEDERELWRCSELQNVAGHGHIAPFIASCHGGHQ